MFKDYKIYLFILFIAVAAIGLFVTETFVKRYVAYKPQINIAANQDDSGLKVGQISGYKSITKHPSATYIIEQSNKGFYSNSLTPIISIDWSNVNSSRYSKSHMMHSYGGGSAVGGLVNFSRGSQSSANAPIAGKTYAAALSIKVRKTSAAFAEGEMAIGATSPNGLIARRGPGGGGIGDDNSGLGGGGSVNGQTPLQDGLEYLIILLFAYFVNKSYKSILTKKL